MGDYLGIDESNHGQYPEIFVAAYSSNLADIVGTESIISKCRTERSIGSLIADTDFLHYIIGPQDIITAGGYIPLRAIIFADMITQTSRLDKVVIDGAMSQNTLFLIKSLLQPNAVPIIEFAVNGDHHFPLVNTADKIAYALYRYYCKLGHSANESAYLDRLIRPDIAGYAKLFHEMGIDVKKYR